MDGASGLDAIEAGHADVEKNDVDTMPSRRQRLQRLLASCCCGAHGDGWLRIKLFGENGEDERIVIDHHDSYGNDRTISHACIFPDVSGTAASSSDSAARALSVGVVHTHSRIGEPIRVTTRCRCGRRCEERIIGSHPPASAPCPASWKWSILAQPYPSEAVTPPVS